MGTVLAVCVSARKGIRKKNVEQATFLENFGIEGDAHAGNWHRQVSLLAWESIEKMRAKGLQVNVGSFAENITTRGIDLVSLPIGSRISIGVLPASGRISDEAGAPGIGMAACAGGPGSPLHGTAWAFGRATETAASRA